MSSAVRYGKASHKGAESLKDAAIEDNAPLKPSLDSIPTSHRTKPSSSQRRQQQQHPPPIYRQFSPPSRGAAPDHQSYRPLVTQAELEQHLKKMASRRAASRPEMKSSFKLATDSESDTSHVDVLKGDQTVSELRSIFEHRSRSSRAFPKRSVQAPENEEFDRWFRERSLLKQQLSAALADSDDWDTVLEEDLIDDDRTYRFHRTPLMNSSLRSPRATATTADRKWKPLPSRTWERSPPGGWSSTSPRRWHVRTSPPKLQPEASPMHGRRQVRTEFLLLFVAAAKQALFKQL